MEIKKQLLLGIANNIKEKRKEKQISQMKLSELADISQSYLANIEIGKYTPSLDTLLKISLALEINPGELFPKMFNNDKKEAIQQTINLLKEMQ